MLQSIAYSNSSASTPASVRIDWTFADGNTGLQGTGGALSVTGSTTIAINSANQAPTITSNGGSATAAVSIAENTVGVTTVTATDANAGQSLSYAIIGGADRSLFAINASGVLTFRTPRDFEAPADADRNNSYVVQVRVADNGTPSLFDTQTITVNVTDVAETTPNRAPVITSNGGGDAALLSVAENGTAVTTVTATDPDAGQTRSYSIVGGADRALFRIGTTGALTFASAPNFEAPADTDRNNSYVVQVRVSDNGSPALSDTQTITVNVTDVAEGGTNRAPVITSNGGGASASISRAENSTAVTTVTATDPDAGNTLTYLISGGADAARFTIGAGTGAVAFLTPPDFEAPADQGANNVYDVVVGVRDNAGLTDTQALAITVTNVNGATLNGDNAANTLTGTPEADTIFGNGGNDTLYGLAGNDTLYGGSGNNTLDGGPGADTFIGGPASDVIVWDPADISVAGGGGFDTLRVIGSGVTLDLTQAVSRNKLDGFGNIDLTGAGNNTAVLSMNEVFAMCWDNNLRFDGNTGDRVTVLDAADWTRGASQVIGANTYNSWTGWDALLLIDSDVSTNLV